MGMDNWMKCRWRTQFALLCTIVPRSWHFMSKPHCKSLSPCLGKWFSHWDPEAPIWLRWVVPPSEEGDVPPERCLGEPRSQEDLTSTQNQSLKEERPMSVTMAHNSPLGTLPVSVHRNGAFPTCLGCPLTFPHAFWSCAFPPFYHTCWWQPPVSLFL